MGKRRSDSTVQQKSSKKPRESEDLGPTLEELEYDSFGMDSYDEELEYDSFGMDSYDEEDMWQTYSHQTYSDVSPRSCDSIVQQKSSKKKPRELKDLGPTLEELKNGPYRTHYSVPEEDRRPIFDWSDDEDDTPSPEHMAEYRRQGRGHAETGLQYYNKKNRTNYQLVEALDYAIFLDDGFWLHCNFTAKRQMDAQPLLFFAEMRFSRSYPRRVTVLTCRILKKGTKTTIDGCTSCSGDLETIIHPINGFRRGQPPYRALTLRSRADWVV